VEQMNQITVSYLIRKHLKYGLKVRVITNIKLAQHKNKEITITKLTHIDNHLPVKREKKQRLKKFFLGLVNQGNKMYMQIKM